MRCTSTRMRVSTSARSASTRTRSRGSTSVAEIEITLPTVQYGNVKVRLNPEEFGVDIASPAAVGTATAIYLNLFTQGFKVGASMDVTASPTEGLKTPQGASQEEAGPTAQELLDKGLDGVTEIPSDEEYDSAAEAREATQARTA